MSPWRGLALQTPRDLLARKQSCRCQLGWKWAGVLGRKGRFGGVWAFLWATLVCVELGVGERQCPPIELGDGLGW